MYWEVDLQRAVDDRGDLRFKCMTEKIYDSWYEDSLTEEMVCITQTAEVCQFKLWRLRRVTPQVMETDSEETKFITETVEVC